MSDPVLSRAVLSAIQESFVAKYPSARFHETTGECIAHLAETWRVFKEGWISCHDTSSQAVVALSPARERRVYVAGPMTGHVDYNFPAFNAQADELRREGWHVENPADHGIVPGADWADYLRYDLGRLVTCAVIMLLPGWSKSKGATLEVHVAQRIGSTIMLAPGAERVEDHAALVHDAAQDCGLYGINTTMPWAAPAVHSRSADNSGMSGHPDSVSEAARQEDLACVIEFLENVGKVHRYDVRDHVKLVRGLAVATESRELRSALAVTGAGALPEPFSSAVKLLETVAGYGAIAQTGGRPTPISEQCSRAARELREAGLDPQRVAFLNSQWNLVRSQWVAVPRTIPQALVDKTRLAVERHLGITEKDGHRQVLREILAELSQYGGDKLDLPLKFRQPGHQVPEATRSMHAQGGPQ